MNRLLKILTVLLISIVVISSGCYIYTNPFDPLAVKSELDLNSVTVTHFEASGDEEETIIIDWADVEDVTEYIIIASTSEDVFLSNDYNRGSEESAFDVATDWRARDWLNWNDLYFRIGYKIVNQNSISWSELFHYPMDPYNPMNEGITLTTSPQLDWASNENVTGYEVDYAKTPNGLDGIADVITNTSDTSVWTGMNLAVDDTVYWSYRVSGRNDEESVHHLWGRPFSFTVKSAPAVRDKYAGGNVFYLDGVGTGLVITDQLIAEEVRWGPVGTDITGDNDAVAPELTGIGDGDDNTVAIYTALGGNAGVAKTCDDLVYRGFYDWYLPSRDELEEADVIIDDEQFWGQVGSGPGIWTSSEYDADNVYVVHRYQSYYSRYKQGLHNVLAVRNFSY